MPHLRLRVPSNALLSRLRSDCDHYISSHFRTNEFVRAYPPIITSSDCEGAGEVFTVQPRQGHVVGVPTTDRLDATASAPHESGMKSSEPEYFFREQKYLTVSSQLHLEAYVHEHQKVWTLSPTFRAEKSDTPRHLSEFYMLEAEERSESLHQIMDTVEGLIRSVATNVEGSMAGRELLQPVHATSDPEQQEMQQKRAALIKNRWQGLKKSYWPRVPYATAVKLLQAAESEGEVSFHHKPEWATGLQLEHEKFLAAEIGLGSPVFITDYPAAVKPFYMLPSQGQDESTPAEQRTVACFDLLLPDLCEVVGGSLREHRLGALQASMSKHGISNMDWYLDLRRFGSVPHGGFGLGFDRLMCYLSGVDNVRDVVPWPRYYGRCDG
jgi:asparaginyl-tRNA synthetase